MRDSEYHSYRILLVAFLAILCLAVTCDKSVEPVPVMNYPVYFGQPDMPSKLFVFHPATRKIDSLNISWQPYEGLAASADGKRLYIGQRTSIVVVDTDSFSDIVELPYAPDWRVSLSPDNKLLAITGDDLYILRTSDYSLVFSDTDKTQNGYFSFDSRTFYCAAGWSSNSVGVVYKVDLSDSLFPVTRRSFSDGGVAHVIPAVDESKLFLYLTVGSFASAFEVYDVLMDSIVFRDFLSPGAGNLAVSPNGRYVFYTNPGVGIIPPVEPSFTIFDVVKNKIDTVVADIEFFSDSNWYAPPNYLAVTPDSRWLTILGGQFVVSVLYLYDIERKQLVFREPWGGNDHVFTNLAVQSSN